MTKKKIGTITSIKSNKTLVVNTKRRYKHPFYSKTIFLTKKYLVHDLNNIGKIGDKILIEQTRPISSTKCWILKYIYN